MPGYWNQDNFEGLEAIAAQADGLPHLQAFARYCRLKASGLRKPAHVALDEFLAEAATLDFAVRKQLVEWLLDSQRRAPKVHQLIPQPLARRLIEPVLAEWLRDHPHDAAGHRWWGILHNDRAALRAAVVLDANEVLARIHLLRNLIDCVAFATHHLPEGGLVYETAFVNQCLGEATQLLAQLPAGEERHAHAMALAQQQMLVDDFLDWSRQPEGIGFEQWCERRQRQHTWGVLYSFDRE